MVSKAARMEAPAIPAPLRIKVISAADLTRREGSTVIETSTNPLHS